jgi:gas vesicle structural protein
MTVAAYSTNRAPRPSSLADVLDLVLDKGIVIDAYVRLALVGIEVLTLDARIVIASVDTYLRFAEAVNRLDLQPHEQATGLPGLVKELRDDGRREQSRGAVGGGTKGAREAPSGRDRRVPSGRSAPRRRRGSSGYEEEDED